MKASRERRKTETGPFLIEGTFILQSVYSASARYDGPRACTYRGHLLDCVRVYAATLKSQAAGVDIECWKLATDGRFEKYPEPLREGEAWSPSPLKPGPIKSEEERRGVP